MYIQPLTEPVIDPQDHACEAVCKHIAARHLQAIPLRDLRELRAWLDEAIEARDAPTLIQPF